MTVLGCANAVGNFMASYLRYPDQPDDCEWGMKISMRPYIFKWKMDVWIATAS